MTIVNAPTMQEILVGARRKLLADSNFHALVGFDVGADALSKPFDDGWVFIGQGNSNSPLRDPANTGTSAITMNLRDTWSSPNIHNTVSLRQLRFTIWSDLTRQDNQTNFVGTYDAELRCSRVADAIKKVFNDVGNNDHDWPNNVYIPSCVLYNDLVIRDVPNKDGLVEGTISFALELF